MGNPHSIGEAFHITSDEVMSWNCIYEMLGASIGVKPHLVHIASESIVKFAQQHNGPDVSGTLLGDKSHSAIFDNLKIKRFVPDYKAVIPFHEGIKRTLEWFEAKQELLFSSGRLWYIRSILPEQWGQPYGRCEKASRW